MTAFLLPYTADANDPVPHIWVPTSNAKVPASLLSRLTEAADGQRNGGQSWFVGQLKRQFKKGHKILGPYATAREAFEADQSLFNLEDPDKDSNKIFGPFITDEDFGTKVVQVERVTLHLKGGREVCLDGTKYDCVFWSASAVDKFVVPYYVQVTNLEEAEDVRNQFMQPSAIAAIHIPGSEIVDGVRATATCPDRLRPDGPESLGMGLLEWKTGGVDGVQFTPV